MFVLNSVHCTVSLTTLYKNTWGKKYFTSIIENKNSVFIVIVSIYNKAIYNDDATVHTMVTMVLHNFISVRSVRAERRGYLPIPTTDKRTHLIEQVGFGGGR